jgi:uncharacterized membrane protein (TIGR02234 family)
VSRRDSSRAGAAGRGASRERGVLVLPALALGVAVLALASRPWVVAQVPGPAGAVGEQVVSGSSAAPAVPALALVALAAAVAVALGRRWGRLLAAACLVLAGAGVAALALAVLADPSAWAAGPVAARTGLLGADPPAARATSAPALAAGAGALVAGTGAAAVARRSRWGAAGSRFERTPAGGAPAAPASGAAPASATWDALSRGEDPTAAGD